MSAPQRQPARRARSSSASSAPAGWAPCSAPPSRAAGHHVVAASGVSAAARDRIARLLPERRRSCPPTRSPAPPTDLLLIAVPDDALAGVVAGLAATGALRPGQVVAHTSGAHGLAVLAPAAAAGARPLALHPAMTFTGTAADLDRLPGISYGVTAPADLKRVRRPGWSPTWAATRSGSPRTTARSTTRPSRTARTTWSRSSTRRWTGCATPGVVHPEKVLGAAAARRPRQRAAAAATPR